LKIYEYAIGTATSAETAKKSEYLNYKKVRAEAYGSNVGGVCVAFSYAWQGTRETDFDYLARGQSRIYSAPKGKKICYVWYYGLDASDTLRITALDGSLQDFPEKMMTKMAGKFKRNRTAFTLTNNTALDVDIAVPSGKIWKILGGYTRNPDNVTRVATVRLFDSYGTDLGNLLYVSLPAGQKAIFPMDGYSTTTDKDTFPKEVFIEGLIAVYGDYIRFHWDAGGVSTGGSGYVYLNVLEFDA
jgi:hypothetical protein